MTSISKKAEPTTIVLGDGNTYTIAPVTLSVLATWEEACEDATKTFLSIQAALYARLKPNHPDITMDDIGGLVNSSSIMKEATRIHNLTVGFVTKKKR